MVPVMTEIMVSTHGCKRVAVAGLGKTGISTVRYLTGQGMDVLAVDTRRAPPGFKPFIMGYPGLQYHLGPWPPDLFDQMDQVVVSPGLPLTDPALQQAAAKGVELVGDVELFARQVKAPVLAITGSNGKSTVTRLLEAMLRTANKQVYAGANLGEPALDLLQKTRPDYYLLELSSFQLETVSSLRPEVAVILNVTPDHMDRYQNILEYTQAKQRIYRHARTMIVNRDDALTHVICHENNSEVVGFTLQTPQDNDFGVLTIEQNEYLAFGNQPLLAANELALFGQHNVANALAALAMGYAIGLSMSAMLMALRTFVGLPHRMQVVQRQQGVLWINDSKATNVGATLAAIRGLPGPLVLIAGGEAKGADFGPLAHAMTEKVKAVLLFGKDAELIKKSIENRVEVHECHGLEQCVKQAHQMAVSGDTVLLAPACASFDMFADYQARGDAFIVAVNQVSPHAS